VQVGGRNVAISVVHLMTRQGELVLSGSAIVRNDETNERTVMIFGADSIAHSITVTVGPATDSLVAIESDDLKPGMNVIIEGNYSLADSTRITIQRDTSKAAP